MLDPLKALTIQTELALNWTLHSAITLVQLEALTESLSGHILLCEILV